VSAYAGAATFCAIGAGFSLNDAADYREDLINNPSRPIARGSLHATSGISFYLCFAGLSMLFGALTKSPDTFLVTISMLAAVSLYSLVLKRVWILKNVIVALTIAMIPLMASSCVHAAFAGTNWLLVVALALWSLEKEIMMDVRDIEGDRMVGLLTVPIFFGRKRTGAILTVVNLAVWVSVLSLVRADQLFSNLGWPAFFAIIHTGLIFYLGAMATVLWIKMYLRLQVAFVATVLGTVIF
jgi:4-hydroxybenzoate polyprenyltransferase